MVWAEGFEPPTLWPQTRCASPAAPRPDVLSNTGWRGGNEAERPDYWPELRNRCSLSELPASSGWRVVALSLSDAPADCAAPTSIGVPARMLRVAAIVDTLAPPMEFVLHRTFAGARSDHWPPLPGYQTSCGLHRRPTASAPYSACACVNCSYFNWSIKAPRENAEYSIYDLAFLADCSFQSAPELSAP